jgi:hypothetical protein
MILPALSIKQPWAWLVVNGFKPLENRNWHTSFRGEILVHTGQKADQVDLFLIEQIEDLIRRRLPDRFETGGIVGRGRITACVGESDSPWFTGDYGFLIRDARPLPFHPCPGKLGFFDAEYPDHLLTGGRP